MIAVIYAVIRTQTLKSYFYELKSFRFVFDVFDGDKSGTIEFNEFLQALSVTSRGNLNDKLEWAFRLYDLDDDGKITRDEMLQIVTAIFSMVGKKDDMKDADPKEKVEKIFSLMNTVSRFSKILNFFIESPLN